jgi:hypothetical protein
MRRLELPTVTLCAATSVNLRATVDALLACTDQIDFAECLLFTDRVLAAPATIKVVPVQRFQSGPDYSRFVLHELAKHVRTAHCLIVQWDGFVIDPSRWKAEFLDYDYVGAPWPQFGDGHDVGNGGFSLRSMRLLKACGDPRFKDGHPEDVAICRTNRAMLEVEHHIRFADRHVAQAFAFERTGPSPSFGFHGVFNMIPLFGVERFAAVYRGLDDRRTIFHDWKLLTRQLVARAGGLRLALRLACNRLRAGFTGLVGRLVDQAT